MRLSLIRQVIDYLADKSRHRSFWKENETKVCEDEEKMSGRIVIVTGSNTGIGKQVTLQMAKRGAVVIMAVRNLEKGHQAREEIMRILLGQHATIHLMQLDLGDMESIRNFVTVFESTYPCLDILINNAGIMDLAPDRVLTKDGFEQHIGINHLGPFLLTRLLLPALYRSPGHHSRIVSLTSTTLAGCPTNFMKDLMLTCKRNIGNFGNEQYAISKLCNSIVMMKLSKDLCQDKVKFFQVCPGLVKTDIFRRIQDPLRKAMLALSLWAAVSSHEGAETVVYCAVSESILARGNGEIYRFTKEWEWGTKICKEYLDPSKSIMNLGNKLYEWSEELIGLNL